jgi:hypothetical protein
MMVNPVGQMDVYEVTIAVVIVSLGWLVRAIAVPEDMVVVLLLLGNGGAEVDEPPVE